MLGGDAMMPDILRCTLRPGWNNAKSIEHEADPRHVEISSQEMNVKDCKTAIAPSTKEERVTKTSDERSAHILIEFPTECYIAFPNARAEPTTTQTTRMQYGILISFMSKDHIL